MDKNGNLVRVIVIILVLLAPAVVIRVLSSVADAPYLLPLALTKEGLAAAEDGRDGGEFSRIDVHVAWGRDWPGTMTQEGLRDVIATTLERQTEFYRFDFEDQPGRQVEITFAVGPNRYGPYPPGKLVTGLQSALIALRMTNGPSG